MQRYSLIEHSWGDGFEFGHVREHCDANEIYGDWYDEYGNCKGPKDRVPPMPEAMVWSLNEDMRAEVRATHERVTSSWTNLRATALYFDTFGRDAIKLCKCSPDAFVQMALQLAFYRVLFLITLQSVQKSSFQLHHFTPLTYESTAPRQYAQMRTETYRVVTDESVAFVRAMCSEESVSDNHFSYLLHSPIA